MAPKRDLTKYSSYFSLQIPSSITQIAMILLLGVMAGEISALIVHYYPGTSIVPMLLTGSAEGLLVISAPALITVMIMRIVKRRMRTKHALFAVLAVSVAYSIFIIFDSAIYAALRNNALPYILLLLFNSSIYGYWFIINRIAVGQKRSAVITAEVQPILNVLIFFPFGEYLLRPYAPIGTVLLKLFSGMLVFLAMGYIILYLLDRPAKKKLSVSSVDLFSSMVGQWLYDLATDATVLGKGGVTRTVTTDIAVISGGGKMKAAFISPDIHYGPFGNVGGSIFTEALGNAIVSKYNASPFIIHSAVNLEDNPMNTNQVFGLVNSISRHIGSFKGNAAAASKGFIGKGTDYPCRAINIRINGTNLLTLSKAPSVTEDIDRSVGIRFKELASAGSEKTILIDAHNSRFESASSEDLKGIWQHSRYIGKYENAIRAATMPSKSRTLQFGSAHYKLSKSLSRPDLGPGYSSVGIFSFGKTRFCMIYIDANNMLPGFRKSVLKHIRSKHKIDAEICTTDTHAVNSIAMSASNALGRHSKPSEILPLLDKMIKVAKNDMEPAHLERSSIKTERFRTWGYGSEDLLNKVGMEIIHTGKKVVPFVIAASYIIAAWVIYII